LDKSSNYEAFSSEMHKYLEQLWTVSDWLLNSDALSYIP
jgi:hypothetical protein